jgi:hypothetical protein
MTGFKSKRQAAQTVLIDDAQGYIADYEAALKIAYEIGFENGKRAAERKPLTDEEIDHLLPEIVSGGSFTVITYGRAVARAIEAAHNIKEGT